MEEEIRQLTAIYEKVVEFAVTYSFQMLGALLIFLLGLWLGGRAARLVRAVCLRHNLDITLSAFFANTAKVVVIAIMTVIALGKVGISIGPFVAALGAISLGAGLALQSSLSNYGAGLNLILTRPFVVGDTIRVQNVTGIVREVKLAHTILTDEDDVQITIPNRHIIGEIIHNSKANTLIELEVGISYKADPAQAIIVIRQALQNLSAQPGDPIAAEVGIDRFGDSNIIIGIRLWGPTAEHFRLRFRANGEIYRALAQAGIDIAYPQREVRMLS